MFDNLPNFNLLYNIFSNLTNLQNDFQGFSVNFLGILAVLINVFFSLWIFIVFYVIGEKIRKRYFNGLVEDKFNAFISTALGYIIVGTGVSILGMFSILYVNVLFVYYLAIILIGFYPFSKIFDKVKGFFGMSSILMTSVRKNLFVFTAILFFVFTAFLRLIPPEVGEDAVGYHSSLPSLYLKNHSIITDTHYPLYLVFPVPQLGEMSYVIAQSVGLKDASRYIHFMSYVLVVLLLFHLNKNKRNHFLDFYAPLLFVTTPVVIQVSSKANLDFQWLICWLLSISIITGKNLSFNKVILSAVLFGGVLATKIWTIAFIPVFILYLLLVNKKKNNGVKFGALFLLFSFIVSAIWYFRAYVLTGYPFYPGFSETSLDYFGFNSLMFAFSTVITFSPLFYFGCILLMIRFRKLFYSRFLLFFILLLCYHFFLSAYGYPRYLLGIYSLAVIIVSVGIKTVIKRNVFLKYLFICIYVVMFSYYFLNTIFILPYGLAWANVNKYLTRVLSRDNASYYNFDRMFDKQIAKNDVVATYGIYGYYYANFSYIDISIFFENKNKKLELLKKEKVSKLFIKGGDFNWFCKEFKIEDCEKYKTKLLASYPQDSKKYNLYSLETSHK